jgi:hypothetical protein
MTAQQTAEPKYTYRRSTDGCDETFDIIHPNGWDIIATRPFCGEEEEQAEADAKLLVHRMNGYPKLLAAAYRLRDICGIQANLNSTASESERSQFISLIFDLVNGMAAEAIAEAEAT